MTQIGEGIADSIIKAIYSKWLFTATLEVTFESGIDVFEVDAGRVATLVPAAGTPHIERGRIDPAVYVRMGGTGETTALKVKVGWNQQGCDGAATIRGESSDGEIVIEGDFNIAGEYGDYVVSCDFTRKPATVANYAHGVGISWEVNASGESSSAGGISTMKLFFVDAAPRPIAWHVGNNYQDHFLQIIDWTTRWASGEAGEASVFNAIWSMFSTGAGARTSHATGYSYWKTGQPVQDLLTLVADNDDARIKGWSCRAIAHLFMECLALHGIRSLEVIPLKANGTILFLVQNWYRKPATIPNWPAHPDKYYAGSWIGKPDPPLREEVPTSLGLTRDMRKISGVPAQGQRLAPLGFSNHWIVEVYGSLYDSSYGMVHPNDISVYGNRALAGWLVDTVSDQFTTGMWFWSSTNVSMAWVTEQYSLHTLQRQNGDGN